MTTMKMIIQNFIFIFWLILCLLPMCYSGTEAPSKSGSFKTSIVSVTDCSNPGRPYLKNPPMIFHPSIRSVHGKNMLSGNLTVLNDTKDIKIKVKISFWSNDKWRQVHNFNNLNCHGSLLHFTFAATNIKYDRKNCMFIKGFYSFQNMDVNELQHIWVPSMPYGRLLWRLESYFKGGMCICKEFDTITEPAFYG